MSLTHLEVDVRQRNLGCCLKLTAIGRQNRYGLTPLLPACGWHGQVWVNNQYTALGMYVAAQTERPLNRYQSDALHSGLTSRITDPAPLTLGIEKQRYRGVRCIRLFD